MYKSYVSSCLKSISKNTATHKGGGYIKKSYDEIIEKIEKPDIFAKKETQTNNAEQIIANLMAKGAIKITKK